MAAPPGISADERISADEDVSADAHISADEGVSPEADVGLEADASPEADVSADEGVRTGECVRADRDVRADERKGKGSPDRYDPAGLPSLSPVRADPADACGQPPHCGQLRHRIVEFRPPRGAAVPATAA
ncbi:hypothetical protein [Streptomyces sp. NPDC058869]|uniref:hypothetical protein n=1 Tax=Streptomyces sp. NPDC058869 TaxID=3346659 RepID=UPI0036ABE4FC